MALFFPTNDLFFPLNEFIFFSNLKNIYLWHVKVYITSEKQANLRYHFAWVIEQSELKTK